MVLIPQEELEEDSGSFFVSTEDFLAHSSTEEMEQEILNLMHANPGKAFGVIFEPIHNGYKFYWFKE